MARREQLVIETAPGSKLRAGGLAERAREDLGIGRVEGFEQRNGAARALVGLRDVVGDGREREQDLRGDDRVGLGFEHRRVEIGLGRCPPRDLRCDFGESDAAAGPLGARRSQLDRFGLGRDRTRAVAGADHRVGEPVEASRAVRVVERVRERELRQLDCDVGDAGEQRRGRTRIERVANVGARFGRCEREVTGPFDGIRGPPREPLVQRAAPGGGQPVVGRRAEQRVRGADDRVVDEHQLRVDGLRECDRVQAVGREVPRGRGPCDDIARVVGEVIDVRADEGFQTDRDRERDARTRGDLEPREGAGELERI